MDLVVKLALEACLSLVMEARVAGAALVVKVVLEAKLMFGMNLQGTAIAQRIISMEVAVASADIVCGFIAVFVLAPAVTGTAVMVVRPILRNGVLVDIAAAPIQGVIVGARGIATVLNESIYLVDIAAVAALVTDG